LYIRNYIFDKARVLAVVGLHPNTFKPHTGTKTSVLFLQKYTSGELEHIQKVRNKYSKGWDKHLKQIRELAELPDIQENDVPKLLLASLQEEFEEYRFRQIGEEETEDEIEEKTNEELKEELKERIESLEKDIQDKMKKAVKKTFKGKMDMERAVEDAKEWLASFSIKTQLEWFLQDEKLLNNYKESWINEQSLKQLDYPIFMAVSEKGGKDNSGNPIFMKNEEGELILDEHNHLVIEHDLDEISNEFEKFAKKYEFYFCNEV
jgi:type I restriction enzyme M protein